MGVSKIIRKTG